MSRMLVWDAGIDEYLNGYIVGRFAAPAENIRDLAHDGVYLWAVDYAPATVYKLNIVKT